MLDESDFPNTGTLIGERFGSSGGAPKVLKMMSTELSESIPRKKKTKKDKMAWRGNLTLDDIML